mgnify:CR=1 FL=1
MAAVSKPKMFEKPAGVRDYLPEAAERLRHIERRVLECMGRWGYREIVTPTLEYYDTVGMASSTSDARLFKLLDKRGVTLVLRSELTAPIARVVATLLGDEPLPLRLSYSANVFRAMEDEAGRDAEFHQTGVELVGDASAEADAEVIALAIASLEAAGIGSFKIALGHVGYLNGLLREALADDPETQVALKECLLRRDHVGYRDRIARLPVSEEIRRELEDLLRLRSGREICEQAARLASVPARGGEVREALDHLCRIWGALCDYGVSEHVLIDLTLIGDFSYYTGMIFEGYAAELGFPVVSGGRYDNLLAQFGRPAPATGFALKTNRILEVVGSRPLEGPRRVLIRYAVSRRAEALRRAAELRGREGYAVETQPIPEGRVEAVPPGSLSGTASTASPSGDALTGGPSGAAVSGSPSGASAEPDDARFLARYDEIITFTDAEENGR